jgi:lipopolysaccharide/colanic/teichoic acid biosynthesis glycosyltransferase
MNNSKLSIMTSSEEAVTAPQIDGYSPSWKTVAYEHSRINLLFDNECCEDERAGLEATASHEVLDTQVVEACQCSDIKQPDLGLWLLYDHGTRHDQWERLRMPHQGGVGSRHFNFQYSSSTIKRGCDVIGSLVLLIMLLPIFILVAILIKLDSPGQVFFRHRRVGKDGNHFVLWKFRSMRTDVQKYETSPRSVADVRLTRVGRLIRRLSVDEMPQLINVLKGEMSLVGPRPEMPFIVARYHPVERERLVAKPGITGLWQISPARAFPIHENLQYDLHYIRNQNLFLDCIIILRTVTAVIDGIGAV